MSPADWVTLTRASLAVGVAALVAASFGEHVQVAVLLSLASVALALDAVDGWVARRTGTEGALGARFDGEVDAFLILVLSVYVARSAGAWVLAIGLARYAFFAAGWPLPWMRAPLPPRYWRKVVAATEGIVLTIAASDVLPPALIQAALVVALALLAESFGHDVWWLWRHRNAAPTTAPARADATLEPTFARSGKWGGAGMRRGIAAALTILAIVVVWAVLVAPDQPGDVTLTRSSGCRSRASCSIVLAVVLPAAPRRVLAGIVGPALGLLVILKILDIAFFSLFARPFDLVGDAGNAGIGIETMRAALGHTEANLIIFGGAGAASSPWSLSRLSPCSG